MDYGDLPTWLASIGTIAAVVVALWLARREGRDRRSADRRHQAEQITAWMQGAPRRNANSTGLVIDLEIQNASSQAVYMFIASLVIVGPSPGPVNRRRDLDYRTSRAIVPPGRTETEIGHGGGVGVFTRFGVDIVFRDARGRSWLRSHDGTLEELRTGPAEHLGLSDTELNWGDYAGQ